MTVFFFGCLFASTDTALSFTRNSNVTSFSRFLFPFSSQYVLSLYCQYDYQKYFSNQRSHHIFPNSITIVSADTAYEIISMHLESHLPFTHSTLSAGKYLTTGFQEKVLICSVYHFMQWKYCYDGWLQAFLKLPNTGTQSWKRCAQLVHERMNWLSMKLSQHQHRDCSVKALDSIHHTMQSLFFTLQVLVHIISSVWLLSNTCIFWQSVILKGLKISLWYTYWTCANI